MVARQPHCDYHFFIQTRPATIMMMIMMITMVAVMVSAMVDLRVIPPSVCVTCACMLDGYQCALPSPFLHSSKACDNDDDDNDNGSGGGSKSDPPKCL